MDDEALAAIDLAVEGDEQLLREALEALTWALSALDRGDGVLEYTGEASDGEAARATITKLEQRLLEE